MAADMKKRDAKIAKDIKKYEGQFEGKLKKAVDSVTKSEKKMAADMKKRDANILKNIKKYEGQFEGKLKKAVDSVTKSKRKWQLI